MATQSPFSLLGQLAERAAQAVQPPAWLVHETQHRLVLFLNHVLMQEPQATERLQRQQGRTAWVQWRQFHMALTVTPAGLFNLAPVGAAPDLRLEVLDSNPLALAQAALRGGKPAVRIEGDVQLAEEVNWLAANVSWDVEEDLARVVGDVPVHHLSQLARTVASTLRQFVGARMPGAQGQGQEVAAPAAPSSPQGWT